MVQALGNAVKLSTISPFIFPLKIQRSLK
jgi:hypothetical protein